ncbi:MAG: DNRLRE domain-containing protein, partial [Deltaproteobacteria bacterium]|nr:DNRLRE domain-containing protein [Deltaproteobacteria bacterium]
YTDARKEMNFGGAGSLNIWSNGVIKILLKSDLSQIPADAVIEKAELKLYCYSLEWPSSDPRLEAYRVTRDWEEGEGTWGEARSGVTCYEYDYYDHDLTETNDWNITGGDIDMFTDFGYGPGGLVAETVMQENSWITFDISGIVQKWVSGEIENHGVLIQATKRICNDANFYSSEYADEELRPELLIRY